MKKAYSTLFIFVLMFCAHLVSARTITVKPGDDINEVIDAASGGDVVNICSGTYGTVNLKDKSYTPSNPLVIQSYGTGTVTILGESGNTVEISNCSYIVLEGLVIEGGLRGLYIKESDHIIVQNNEIKKTGQEGCHIAENTLFVDLISNYIHHTGNVNSKWGEGIYVGRGYYGDEVFPDNCENIWIANNEIHDCGNGEAINIKGEAFHVTVKGNTIYNIVPGTSVQYNQAAISLEGPNNSIDNNYRLTESRDLWVDKNEIYNITGGQAEWNNGIMCTGSGCYIVNNSIHDCGDNGIFGNNYASLDLPIYIYNNTLSSNGQDMSVNSKLTNIYYTDPGNNPNVSQNWYQKRP